MNEANKFKLGVFVTVGIVLLFLSLFMLGMRQAFKPKMKFMTLFTESVQGLNVGAEVKYKGVPIGKVTKISIRAKDKVIRVEMTAFVDSINFKNDQYSESRGRKEIHFREFVDQEIKNGLRCQLKPAGITGLSYVEVDYYNPEKDEVKTKPLDPSEVYIPSTPGLFAGIKTDFTETLARIAKIDFQKISNELTESLESANKLLKDPKLNQIIARIDQVGKNLQTSTNNVNKVFTEKKLTEMTEKMSASLQTMNDLAEKIKKELDNAKVSETSESFREAANTVSGSKEAILDTLAKLDEALDAITEFVDYLDEDPSALIKGKQKPQTLETLKKEKSN